MKFEKDINGKCLVFSDIHYGKQKDCLQNIRTCDMVVDKIVEYVKLHSIDNIIFLGDWYNNRDMLNVQTINSSCKSMRKLASCATVHFILGNHDMYNRNTTEINSAEMFQDIDNLIIYEKPEIVTVNGHKSLFAPWLTDFSIYNSEQFDYVFGHLDLLPRQLTESFEKRNANKVSVTESLSGEIDTWEIISKTTEDTIPKTQDEIDVMIDIVKSGGTMWLGHIHQHSKYSYRNRHEIFVGSPWQQDMSEIKSKDGFYVLDENMSSDFIELKDIPHIININVSDIIRVGVDVFDYSIVEKNTVHLNFDTDVDQFMSSRILKTISNSNPHYEIHPDYNLPVKYIKNDKATVDETRKSILDFCKDYVNGMDNETILNSGFSGKTELMDMLANYYNTIKESTRQ